jgi:hypothetical protein
MAMTRSSPKVWLLGKPDKDILCSGLPTNGAVLRNFLFHHQEKGLKISDSAKAAVDTTLVIWQKARIPTQRVDSGVRKLSKLYDEYCTLKKNRLSPKEGYRVKEQLFKADLDELFDISRKDSLSIMKNEEDKQFLLMQQQDPSSSSLSVLDKSLAQQESRKRARINQALARKKKYMETTQQTDTIASSIVENSSSSATSSSSESDDDFQPPSTPTTSTQSQPKKLKRCILTTEVAASLDRVKLPDRGAMFVVGAVAQALGHDLEHVSLSRNTIHRARVDTRKAVATTEQTAFAPDSPLLLHWDGKLLPDIAGSKEVVDRVAIVVTSGDMEQLLAVPKIGRGTGEEQSNACLCTLADWKLAHLVGGLVFDTTASNTGLQMGACTLIEKALKKDLVWIACRHHVFEVMLTAVSTVALGATSGPEVGVFKRFQNTWSFINKADFRPAGDELFVGMPTGLRQEMILFYVNAIKSRSPREDYRELLQLCHVFLGGSSDEEPFFRTPGAMHHARWMSKAIYSLKIILFKDQMKLTAHERAGLTKICLFVSLVYARYWHEAPLAERAPLNDFNLLALLHEYPVHAIRDAAVKAFRRHLWYFSEHLVSLALFDDRVDEKTKQAMVDNFSRPSNGLKRQDGKVFDHLTPLEAYVTCGSSVMFDLLSVNGQEKAKVFLSKPPALWHLDHTYQSMKAKVKLLKVVNDCAERGVALVQAYNSALTKDETQKQYLLRLVSSHRKQFPAPTKAALKTL